MLGHLVSNRAAPVLQAQAGTSWLKRLLALLLRRP